MKNPTLLILILTSINLFGQQKTAQNSSNNALNFVRIIRYSVFVRDTAMLKNELSKTDPDYQISEVNFDKQDLYIDQLSFNQFITVVLKYLNDKNTKAYSWGKQLKKEEQKKQVFKCDTIDVASIDDNGNEYIVKMYTCDSSYLFRDIKSIEFNESWWIDPKTYELKKEVLSYSLIYYDENKGFYRSAITIYRDEEAVKKINELVR